MKLNSNQNFSLTELLVVIAILSILMMLLSPSLRRISAQADAMQCLSNLKNIGMESLFHVDDHDGILPHNSTQPDPSTGKGLIHTYWTDEMRLPGYPNNGGNHYNKWYERLSSYDSKSISGSSFHCPNTVRFVEPKNPGGWSKTYSMSQFIAGDVNGYNYGTSNRAPPPRLNEIANTAFLAADGVLEKVWLNGEWTFRPTPPSIMSTPNPNTYGGPYFWYLTGIHGERFWNQGHLTDNQCNFVFLDGHAMGMSIEDYWILAAQLIEENPGYWGLSTAFMGGRNMSNK